jgi:hypothetical protein
MDSKGSPALQVPQELQGRRASLAGRVHQGSPAHQAAWDRQAQMGSLDRWVHRVPRVLLASPGVMVVQVPRELLAPQASRDR